MVYSFFLTYDTCLLPKSFPSTIKRVHPKVCDMKQLYKYLHCKVLAPPLTYNIKVDYKFYTAIYWHYQEHKNVHSNKHYHCLSTVYKHLTER